MFLDFDESDVVVLKPVVVILFIGCLMLPIAVAAGRWFCTDLVFQNSLLEVGKYVVPMLSTDALFFDGGLLAGGAS